METHADDNGHDEHDEHDAVTPWKRVLALLLIGGVLLTVQCWRDYEGLTNAETMELASVARNMVQGRGFIASCVRPADLWFMGPQRDRTAAADHMRDIRNGPVYPSVLALGFLLGGLDGELSVKEFTERAEYRVILPLSIVCMLLAGILIFMAAQRLLGESAALLVLTLYVLSTPFLELGLWGGPLSLQLVLGAAALLAVLRCVQHREGPHGDEIASWLAPLLCAGFLVGVSMLTRYRGVVMGVTLLVVLFVGANRRRCWLSCLFFVGVVILTLSPWLVRNTVASGRLFGIAPYTLLNGSVLFEGDGFDASLSPVLGNFSIARAVKARLVEQGGALLESNAAGLGLGVVMALFLAALFVHYENRLLATLRRGVVAGLGGLLLVMALTDISAAYELLPCVFILAVAGFYGLIHNIDFREPEQETLAVLALVLWVAFPTAIGLMGSGHHRPFPPYSSSFIQHFTGLLSKGETLCSDIPWATAWYGGRTSILLPRSVEAFDELKRTQPALAGLHITGESVKWMFTDAAVRRPRVSWRSLMVGHIPPDFPFTEAMAFPPSTRDQWFFTDRDHLSAP